MNQPWEYMCPPSQTLLQPPSPSHPSGLSQCTGFECPVSCIELGLVIYFIYGNIHVSMLFSQIISPLPSPRVHVLYICVSFAVLHTFTDSHYSGSGFSSGCKQTPLHLSLTRGHCWALQEGCFENSLQSFLRDRICLPPGSVISENMIIQDIIWSAACIFQQALDVDKEYVHRWLVLRLRILIKLIIFK